VSDEFPKLQTELKERLDLCVREMQCAKLPFAPGEPSPIFQAPCDSPRVAFRVAELLKERGFYCCVCVFPAVPMNRPGLRFTVTRHNDPADIAAFVMTLDECRNIALGEVARTRPAAVSAQLT
jgi:7-keto-8-aminopelargonate synthetase-like enzyme